MRFSRRFVLALAPAGLLCYALAQTKAADPVPVANGSIEVSKKNDKSGKDPATDIQLTAGQQPPPGSQPTQDPVAPPSENPSVSTPLPRLSAASTSTQSSVGAAPSAAASASLASAFDTSPSVAVSQAQATGLASTDTGDLLSKSLSTLGVTTEKRSPIVNQPSVIGFNIGQIVSQADGAYWAPARQDLDTFLSKVDSGNIQDAIVIKGPYSALYGPGFSFIDIETQTAHTTNGEMEYHGRSYFNYNTNGEGLYGRQDVSIAGPWWGAFVSYGQRTANDYHNGSGVDYASSYDSRDLNAVLDFNLTSNLRFEVGYLRLDQTGLEFPGEAFDTNFLGTNAVRFRTVLEDPSLFARWQTDVYWNRTVMEGSAPGYQPLFPVLNGFFGTTDIDQSSTGFRSTFNIGKIQDRQTQFTVGTDFRYLDQELNEFSNKVFFNQFSTPDTIQTNNPIPRSYQLNLGLFAEYAIPAGDAWTFKFGGRLDYDHSDELTVVPPGYSSPAVFYKQQNAAYFGETAFSGPNAVNPNAPDLERSFGMWMLFATGSYKVNDNWTITSGVGHADRPPTITELYAVSPFLAVLQSGNTTVNGNPDLKPEHLWQIDLGTKGVYEYLRTGANVHAAFVQDYITFQERANINGANFDTVQYENTGLAFLLGTELYSEVDVTGWLTPFATLAYTAGMDMTRRQAILGITGAGVTLGNAEEPLPMMSPLESRIGVKIHEARQDPRYGMEVGVRMVGAQNMVASSLGEVQSSGFNVWNVRGFWRVNDHVLLTSGIDNLFDRTYRENNDLLTGLNQGFSPYAFYRPGFTAYFGTELKF